MSETWEQTKQRVKLLVGISSQIESIKKEVKPWYEETIPEIEIPLYEIRKITLPVGLEHPQGKVILSHVTRKEADQWLEKLKVKSNTEGWVFYEKFLIGASVKERDIYSNPERFCIEDFPEMKLSKEG